MRAIKKTARGMMPQKVKQEIQGALALIAEEQELGDSFIRLSEYSSSKPLTELQKDVLFNQEAGLDFLGLALIPQLEDAPYLKAGQIVGSARFVHGHESVIIQVEPKIGNADFLKMLDYTSGLGQINQQQTRLGIDQGSPVELFLEFFADQMLAFLHRSNYRSYFFATSRGSNDVKGRPLVQDYLINSLPRGLPHVLSCRYLEFSPDVLENQILALAIHTATQLASLLPSPTRRYLIEKLRNCVRLLPGVSVRKITVADIRGIRYNRMNSHFKPIHRLCEIVLSNCSISLKPGQKLPFLSFAIDMARLFEVYVSAAFSQAFKESFVGNKSRLRFPLGVYDKSIVLDGLLSYQGKTVVIECKYKEIGQTRDEQPANDGSEDYAILGGRIRGTDIYQAAAYAGHSQVRANASILVYPAWVDTNSPISISKPIDVFGWHAKALRGVPIYLLGINLSSAFKDVVQELRSNLSRITNGILPEM